MSSNGTISSKIDETYKLTQYTTIHSQFKTLKFEHKPLESQGFYFNECEELHNGKYITLIKKSNGFNVIRMNVSTDSLINISVPTSLNDIVVYDSYGQVYDSIYYGGFSNSSEFIIYQYNPNNATTTTKATLNGNYCVIAMYGGQSTDYPLIIDFNDLTKCATYNMNNASIINTYDLTQYTEFINNLNPGVIYHATIYRNRLLLNNTVWEIYMSSNDINIIKFNFQIKYLTNSSVATTTDGKTVFITEQGNIEELINNTGGEIVRSVNPSLFINSNNELCTFNASFKCFLYPVISALEYAPNIIEKCKILPKIKNPVVFGLYGSTYKFIHYDTKLYKFNAKIDIPENIFLNRNDANSYPGQFPLYCPSYCIHNVIYYCYYPNDLPASNTLVKEKDVITKEVINDIDKDNKLIKTTKITYSNEKLNDFVYLLPINTSKIKCKYSDFFTFSEKYVQPTIPQNEFVFIGEDFEILP